MSSKINFSKISFWQYVFYFCWLVLGIWLILKVMGFIQTPLWLEYGVPVGSLIIGILGIYRDLINKIHVFGLSIVTLNVKFDNLEAKFNKLELKVDHIDKDVHTIKTDVVILKKDVGELKQIS